MGKNKKTRKRKDPFNLIIQAILALSALITAIAKLIEVLE